MPADIAPSPITATTLFFFPVMSRATAMPSAAEIEVEECAAPNGSYSLSARLVKPDVPDQLVVRRVEHVVQRHREFHDAEAGAEVTAGLGDGVDHLAAQLVG